MRCRGRGARKVDTKQFDLIQLVDARQRCMSYKMSLLLSLRKIITTVLFLLRASLYVWTSLQDDEIQMQRQRLISLLQVM